MSSHPHEHDERRYEQLEADAALRAKMEERLRVAERQRVRDDALFYAIRLLIAQGELRSGVILLEQIVDPDYADFSACELTHAALERGDRALAEACYGKIRSFKRRVEFSRSGLGKIHRPPQSPQQGEGFVQ